MTGQATPEDSLLEMEFMVSRQNTLPTGDHDMAHVNLSIVGWSY